MKIDMAAIQNPSVRQFYAVYWSQRQILHDFYNLLSEAQYDYRMVDTPERKSDSPRQSLAHILYVDLVYLNAVKTGKLEFKSMGTEHFAQLTKEQLLAEMERIEAETLAHLTAAGFDPAAAVDVPWGGKMGALNVLYFLHEHDILHIGWNLALMDHLNIPRYASLTQYWGP